ncbi:hypothetical protein [Hymenobacter edaphi]|uniref:hypothetical protein n=1 Tax=Hymenobacter edaphi TaxID=2211146 RepID=UPI001403BCA2|nr:hypothetical protein [Hymenobacter edaphi]
MLTLTPGQRKRNTIILWSPFLVLLLLGPIWIAAPFVLSTWLWYGHADWLR